MVKAGEKPIVVSFVCLHPEDAGCLTRSPVSLDMSAETAVGVALARFLHCDSLTLDTLFAKKAVAVFGMTVQADDFVHDGDRIEVLDDLRFDPMDSRRRRARHKQIQPKSRRRASAV